MRYRGYYYDSETGLYYLNSRYYDPATGRFLNADIYVNANGDLSGYNIFAYCSNNPVMYLDSEGKSISLAILGGIALFAGTSGLVSGLLNVTGTLIESTDSTREEELTWQEVGASFAGGFVSGAVSGGISAAVVASGPLGVGAVVGLNSAGGAVGSALGAATEMALNGKKDKNVVQTIAVDAVWGGTFGAIGGLMEDPIKTVNPKKF